MRLDPFFIGKFEVTQGQWVRQRGHNNSMSKPGSRDGNDGTPVTAAHPVDCVAWAEASRIAGEWGLALPTGAQWEYAARAGKSGAHWCGESIAALAEAENLKSADATHELGATEVRKVHRANARLLAHVPVGRFRPNPFGLFDVLGNVQELTADVARPYSQALRDGDGCTSNVDSGTQRGSDANTLPGECHVSRRSTVPPETPNAGLRVARRIEGSWSQD